jgi:hypothetical protein
MKKNVSERLVDSILNKLNEWEYQDKSGNQIPGQALSFLRHDLYNSGWSGLGNICQFQDKIEELGFKVVIGKNIRGQKCQVVTI